MSARIEQPTKEEEGRRGSQEPREQENIEPPPARCLCAFAATMASKAAEHSAAAVPLALERTRSLLWQYESLLLITSSLLSSRLLDEDNAGTSSSSSSSSSDNAEELSQLFDFPSLSMTPQVIVALKVFKSLGGTSKGQKGKAMRRRLLHSLCSRMRDIMAEVSVGMLYKGSASSDDSSAGEKRRREEPIRLNPTLIRAGYLTPLLGDARLAQSVLASDAMGGDDLVFEQFYGKLKKVKESKLAQLPALPPPSAGRGGVSTAGEMLAAMVAAASAGSAVPTKSADAIPPLAGGVPVAPTLAAPAAASLSLDVVDLCEVVTSSVDTDFSGAEAEGAASLAKALTEAVEASTPPLLSRAGAAPSAHDDDVRRPPFSFTTDEVYGKYLDLSISHAAALQVPGLSSSSEALTLQSFASLLSGAGGSSSSFGQNFFSGTSAPAQAKLANRKKYHAFLATLHEYLALFLLRVQPFLDLRNDVYAKENAVTSFEDRWVAGTIKGWEAEGLTAAAASKEPKAELTLEVFVTSEALEKHLATVPGGSKAECRAKGLKEGGSEAERIARLWSTRGVPKSDWPKKILASGAAAPAATSDAGSASVARIGGGSISAIDLAYLEVLVGCLLAQLRPTLLATIGRLARSATQTLAERAREVAEDVEGRLREIKATGAEGDEDEEEEAVVYNPKNIPLGWDGKPIPYWLYKLHGLNHSFPCEICGNESYRGRRAFERHFTEPKHAFGMRCLGIPNTKHFHGVTGIDDAKRLWTMMGDKMGVALTEGSVDGKAGAKNTTEEYEDLQGNVLSRGAYEDLARQGLL